MDPIAEDLNEEYKDGNTPKQSHEDEKRLEPKEDYMFQPRAMQDRPPRLLDRYPNLAPEDFKYIKFLGQGAFGTVDLVKCKLNGEPYALKQLVKKEIARLNR